MEYSRRSVKIYDVISNLFYFIITCMIVSTMQSDIQLNFDKTCYLLGDDAILNAKYTGTGTVEYINWYYDKILAIIDANTCSTFVSDSWYRDRSYLLGDDAILNAKYTGTGTVEYINWYYDKILAIIDANTCSTFVSDSWYRDRSLARVCDSVSNTFSIMITALDNSDFGRDWGVSLRLSAAETTPVVRHTMAKCLVSIYFF